MSTHPTQCPEKSASRIRVVATWVVAVAFVSTSLATLSARQAPAATGSVHRPADPPVADLASPHISPDLDGVPVQGSEYVAAQRRYDQILAQIAEDVKRHDDAVTHLVDLGVEREDLTRKLADDRSIKQTADGALEEVSTRLRHLALQKYIGRSSGSARAAELALDSQGILDHVAAEDLGGAVVERSLATQRTQLAISTSAAKRISTNTQRLFQVNADIDKTTSTRDQAALAAVADTKESARRHQQLLVARATSIVVGTNLPLVALDAYVRGAALANVARPGCRMSWDLLAGIGQIESHQGTHGGARLGADGLVSKPIFGIPLDGSGGNEHIVAPGGGFSRAEGPMQFLPTTWAAVSVDGDDDNKHDPQNLYDAAASAASYLCRRGVSVDEPSGRRAAILTYNNSGAYVRDVVAAAQGYLDALPVIPPPPASP